MLDLEKKELEEFTKGDQDMREYKNKLNKLNSNDEFVDRISAEEDRLYCYNSDIEIAKEDGKTEGKKENSIEIAKTLLSMGLLSIDKISEATGLSKEEIQSLKE